MDRILYEVVTKPGGIDGKDHTDKGGTVILATFDKQQATDKINGWYTLTSRVINTDTAKAEALSKLTPADKLVLGL